MLDKVRGVLTEVIWKHKQDIQGNFCDECRTAHKPATVEDCSQHVCYVYKSDSYWISWRTWRWTHKLSYLLLVLKVLNSYISLASCGSQTDHKKHHLSSTFVKYEGKGDWTSVQPKRKTKPRSQSNNASWNSTHQTLASCKTALQYHAFLMKKRTAIDIQCSKS
jgi:hypothetical protein